MNEWHPHHGHHAGAPHPQWDNVLSGIMTHELHDRLPSSHREPISPSTYPGASQEQATMVVSGDRAALKTLQAQLQRQGHYVRM